MEWAFALMGPGALAMLMPNRRWLLRYVLAGLLLAAATLVFSIWSLGRPHSSGWGEGGLILLTLPLLVSLFIGVGIRAAQLGRRDAGLRPPPGSV